MAGLGVGLAVGLGSPSAGGGGGPVVNPNLLLWSEAFDQAAWVKTNCDVTADIALTADQVISSGPGATIGQSTATPATLGVPAVLSFSLTGGLARKTVTGTFDGLQYTMSFKIRDASGGDGNGDLVATISRSGGVLFCQITDPIGTAIYIVTEAQLEQSASFTTYHFRGGT